MKLEEGKQYIDGTGERVTVKLKYPETKYPFERTTEDNPLRHMEDGRYLDSVGMPVNVFDLKEIEERSYRNNGKENISILPDYTQVCVWPGTSLGGHPPEDFVAYIAENFNGVRVQVLEEIYTKPGSSPEETGNRCDLFFAVHKDDIGQFAVPRLSYGIRWIEDVLSTANYRGRIYPERVFKYKTWEA